MNKSPDWKPHTEFVLGEKEDGSPGRARTADLVINSHPLYRLSYRGIGRRYVTNEGARGQLYEALSLLLAGTF